MNDISDRLHFFRRPNRLVLVNQTESAECSLACLTMIAKYHGHEVDLVGMRRKFGVSMRGATLSQAMDVGRALGFHVRPVRVELDHLRDLHLPCILHWDLKHFVVLHRVVGSRAEIYDPARGVRQMLLSEVSDHFTGVALELLPGSDFAPIKEAARFSLRQLAGRVTGLKRSITQVLGIAVGIEILGLILPYQTQWVLDQALVTSDSKLLGSITVAFLLVVFFQGTLVTVRGYVVSWLGAALNVQWITNLFRHLLKLPLEFFEKRQLSDVLSRFTSVRTVQNTLTGSFIETCLDGVMACALVFILSCYSFLLTVIVMSSLAIYFAIRSLIYAKLRAIREDQLVYAARQQSEMMESVRGIQAIKLASKEDERCSRFMEASLELAQLDMRSQRMSLLLSAASKLLFGFQRVLLMSLGAMLALRSAFTAGMLVAYIAYSDQLYTRVGGLIDKALELKLLQLHLDRISDIALTIPEDSGNSVQCIDLDNLSIVVKNLGFRYAEGEPWVLRGLNIDISPGESVAIVGPSGCGKSTLIKLMLGLLRPTEGEILIGGINITKYGMKNYRKLVTAVMQTDYLFSGSVAENIAFFNSDASLDQIETAARAAGIHEVISRMPMGYDSLLGDMGSLLSGGERQRVLLARAFFRQPKALFLDEATSHLDVENERLINEVVRRLSITRVVVAHRQDTIRQSDRIIALSEINC